MDNKKNYRNVDLSGQKFHRLTALHKVEGHVQNGFANVNAEIRSFYTQVI